MKKYAYAPSGVVAEVFSIEGEIKEQRHPEFAEMCFEIEGPAIAVGWVFDGETFSVRTLSIEKSAIDARLKRDELLRGVYEPKINIAQRDLRLAGSEKEKADAVKLIFELDSYAMNLQKVPDQPGYPTDIEWPQLTQPT